MNPIVKPMTQVLGSPIFLFDFYTSTSLSVHFPIPRPSRDAVLQERLARIMITVPDGRPVLLYDHTNKEANTVGLLPSHSRIYITTGLLASMSDEGMRGVIAHEDAHVHERHTFATFTYTCRFAMSDHLLDNNNFLPAILLLFLGTCRYCKYRADVGIVRPVGREAILMAPRELAVSHPSKFWVRWFSLANIYPALAMRMRAVETGRKTLP